MKQQAWLVPILLAFGVPLATHAQSTRTDSPFADQTDQDETVYLSPFEVSSVGVGDYHVVDSGMNRVNRPLIDTAASIQIVTSEFIEHIGAGSAYEAAQYLSGVSVGNPSGPGARDEYRTIRGFAAAGIFGEGAPGGEPELIERVEIVKGPSMFTVTSNAGGVGTIVTKSPKFESANSLKVEVADQYFGNKVSFDSTGTIPGTERFAYRLIATHRDAHSYLPGRVYLKSINPMFTWQISDKTQLKLKGFLHDQGHNGVLASNDGNLPIRDDFPYGTGATISKADIKPGYVPFAANGSAYWATRGLKTRNVSADFTSTLTDQLHLRILVYREHKSDRSRFGTVEINRSGPAGNIGQVDPHTGRDTPNTYWVREDPSQPWHEQNNRYIPIYVDPTTNIDSVRTAFVSKIPNDWNIATFMQANLAGKFDFGGSPSAPLFTLQGVVGTEFWMEDHRINKSYDITREDITGIYDPTWDFMPNPRPPTINPNPPLNYMNQLIKEERGWYYANIQFDTFRGRLILGGGITYRTFDREHRNLLTGVPSVTDQTSSNPTFSALVKITQDASVYAAYSENTTPGSYYPGNGLPNEPLWQDGEQSEFGVKMYFFNRRLSISAAYFDLAKKSQARDDPRDIVASRSGVNRLFPSLLEDITNEGFEFDIAGKITENLSILGSATKQKMRNQANYRLQNTPDTLYNGFIRYGFSRGMLDGLSLQLGFQHAEGSPGNTPSANPTILGVRREHLYFLPARTIFNAGAGYTWGKLRFQLNIDNLFDEDKPYLSNARDSVKLVPPRNIRLTTTIHF